MLARGLTQSYSTYACALAEAVAEQGRDEEAEEIARAGEAANAVGVADLATFCLGRRVRALVLARRGELVEAEALAREALTHGRKGADGSPLSEGEHRFTLGRVLALAGKDADARAELDQAIRLFERKGATAWVNRTRSLLATLTTPSATLSP
jgi:hypothetical protein